MKSVLAFCFGFLVATAVLLFMRSQERDRTSIELGALREQVASAERDVQRQRETNAADGAAVKTTNNLVPADQVAVSERAAAPSVAPANSAILGYLGDPVPAPQNLDPKYSPEQLATVFRSVCEAMGIKLEQIGVDTSEFPYIIHGQVEKSAGAAFYKELEAKLRGLPGYAYNGSVTGSGAKDRATTFAINVIPNSAYSGANAEIIQRRLMLRLQMTAAAWSDQGL